MNFDAGAEQFMTSEDKNQVVQIREGSSPSNSPEKVDTYRSNQVQEMEDGFVNDQNQYMNIQNVDTSDYETFNPGL